MRRRWIWLVAFGLSLFLSSSLRPAFSFNLNDVVGVVGTGDSGLRVREEAGPSARVLKVVPDGWTFRIIGGPVSKGGHTWWKVRDERYETSPTEGWTAGEWLVRVSPDALVPASVPDYFSSNQDKVEEAIAWATAQKGKTDWSGLCLKFVREAFKGELLDGWTSAEAARRKLESEGKFYSWVNCWNPPRGALIFFSALGEYKSFGHVGIYLGDQGVVHSYGKVRTDAKDGDKSKGIVIVENLSKIDSYIGWAYAHPI